MGLREKLPRHRPNFIVFPSSDEQFVRTPLHGAQPVNQNTAAFATQAHIRMSRGFGDFVVPHVLPRRQVREIARDRVLRAVAWCARPRPAAPRRLRCCAPLGRPSRTGCLAGGRGWRRLARLPGWLGQVGPTSCWPRPRGGKCAEGVLSAELLEATTKSVNTTAHWPPSSRGAKSGSEKWLRRGAHFAVIENLCCNCYTT